MTVLAVTNLGADNNPVRPAGAVDGEHESTPFPAPPAGMKWVGQNGVVVAVPALWPVSESPCGTGAPGEVLDGTMASSVGCILQPQSIARVMFTPLAADPFPTTARGCDESAPPFCYGGEVFPDQGMSVWVSIKLDDAEAQVKRILGSAMVLPAGWTTVPFDSGAALAERVTRLEQAGFTVEVTDSGAVGRFNIHTTPELGAPIEEGATITLSAVGGVPAGGAEAPVEVAALPCPPTDRGAVDLDVSGPGRARPEEAAAPYIDAVLVLASRTQTQATVYEVAENGLAARVFFLSRRPDGWWPDAYQGCGKDDAATPSALTCGGRSMISAAPPFGNPDGVGTRGEAIGVFLTSRVAAALDSTAAYVIEGPGRGAWLLRDDGSAHAHVNFETSNGYAVWGYQACAGQP
ncbi:hypothetical protein [Nocardioides psychrotolerans]|uniref:hypothetical protein n=1 Tax=Nocardioides psychrotolerans TaxID=1005945 RepID=UPI0011602D39|nr:hypothetical protein [Nocardioides psychrotolerans]